MSSISAHSKTSNSTQSTVKRLGGLKPEDLALVAERLSLIQGHLSQMPPLVVSGARKYGDFLLVAIKITGHELDCVGGVWRIDGKDVTQLTRDEKK